VWRNDWRGETRNFARKALRLVYQVWQTLRANMQFLFLEFQRNQGSFLFRYIAIQTNSLCHGRLQNKG
jgi:hypothetical protein